MVTVPRFKNRREAGELLAAELTAYSRQNETRQNEALILALPRGGVPVAFAVAQALGLELDILLVRKLGVPGHEEYAMGAIASGGWSILQQEVVQSLGIPTPVIEATLRRESAELHRREQLYRPHQPPLQLAGRTVILIDDGLATGTTMRVAVQAVSASTPARIVVAVPVASQQACRMLSELVDEMICLRLPDPFYAVGLWYDNFDQTSDEEVMQLLKQARTTHAQCLSTENDAAFLQGQVSRAQTNGNTNSQLPRA